MKDIKIQNRIVLANEKKEYGVLRYAKINSIKCKDGTLNDYYHNFRGKTYCPKTLAQFKLNERPSITVQHYTILKELQKYYGKGISERDLRKALHSNKPIVSSLNTLIRKRILKKERSTLDKRIWLYDFDQAFLKRYPPDLPNIHKLYF